MFFLHRKHVMIHKQNKIKISLLFFAHFKLYLMLASISFVSDWFIYVIVSYNFYLEFIKQMLVFRLSILSTRIPL